MLFSSCPTQVSSPPRRAAFVVAPVFRHDVSRARFGRPIRDPYCDPDVARSLSEYDRLLDRAASARTVGWMLAATRLEEHAGRLLDGLDDRSVAPTVLFDDASGEIATLRLSIRGVTQWLHGASGPDAAATCSDPTCCAPVYDAFHRVLWAKATGVDTHPDDPREAFAILEQALSAGLALRANGQLSGLDEAVLVHFLVLGMSMPARRRVCETCRTVFEGRRGARQCSACRNSRPRTSPRPWHRVIRVAARPSKGRRFHVFRIDNSDETVTLSVRMPLSDRTMTYETLCGCGTTFTTNNGALRLCHRCGSGAARTARWRARRRTLPRLPKLL